MRRVALLALALAVALPAGAGAKTVHFQGKAVQAPASWPVIRLARHPRACVRLDRRAVYLGRPGSGQRCPAHAIGRRRAILVPGPPTSAQGAGASRVPPARISAASDFTGLGFDACTAPSRRAMAAWLSSPYSAIGVYIGGLNRGCSQPALTASWVAEQIGNGWHLIPTYVGLQSPTSSCTSCAKLSVGHAASQGAAAANDAVGQARLVGIGTGSPIYFDMESYTRTSSATAATLQFLAAWTARIHDLGYRSGVYSSSSSGIADLASRYGTGYASPDDLWIANWNGRRDTSDPFVPASAWSDHQRIHQYRGGHDESYGGVTINIDGDYVEGDTAGTVASGSDDPKGRVELAESPAPGNVRIVGWAFDPSSPTVPVTIRAYVGGQRSAARYELGPIAEIARPDIATSHRAAGADHGFDARFATIKTGRQRVCVYAVDIGPGNDKLLGCRGMGIGVAVTMSNLRVVRHGIRALLRCEWPAGTECPGQLLLNAKLPVHVARRRGRARTRLVRVGLARRRFKLGGGRSHEFSVQLTKRGRQLSGQGRLRRAQLVMAIPGGRRARRVPLR
jgi:hypothetical protein